MTNLLFSPIPQHLRASLIHWNVGGREYEFFFGGTIHPIDSKKWTIDKV
jgi:hypothetical protein